MGWVFDWHGQDGRATGPLDVACTVTQTYGAGGGNAPMVVDIVCRASTQGGAESQMNTATTLTTDHDRTIIAHRNESVCIQGSMIGRTDKNGPQGSGTNKGVCFTLNTIDRHAVAYEAAPFKVSDRCCYYLKEKPADIRAKVHNSAPYLGLMASEGGRREKSLMMHGCNYFGKSTVRSAPFAIFSRQDILQLALDLGVPVPEEYGEIARDVDGTLRTTLAQRTGCTMCGFGVHLEKRPNRFDRLRESNHKEWEFWMRHVCRDEDGNWYGWGRVLDYIGVEWENEPGQITGQLTFD